MTAKNTSKASNAVNLNVLDALDDFGAMSFGKLIEGGAVQPDVAPAMPDGEPMIVKTADIEEDSRQLRKKFDLTELRASIRENVAAGRRPIKTPLSVKRHLTIPNKWKLNDGARRLRSAIAEGVDEVPAFIDEEHDAYDQVVVNLQRDGNTPLELADFIAEKMAEGDKKGTIAKRLGKCASWVSKHSALIGMPELIRQAYDNERCNDVEALYLLAANYEAYPDAIAALCLNGTDLISKYTVMDLLEVLKNPVVPRPMTDAEPAASVPAVPVDGTISDSGDDGAASQATLATGAANNSEVSPRVTGNAEVRGSLVDHRRAPAALSGGPKPEEPVLKPEADTGKLRKAIVQVQHDMRAAKLLLDRRAAEGKAWIKYDSDGAEIQIEIGSARLVGIVEGA